jgi:hypothetical protein
MTAEEYLGRSRLFRKLKRGPHGRLVELYAERLVRVRLAHHGVWRCLNLFSGLTSWLADNCLKLKDLDESAAENFLCYRSKRQTIQPGDRAALTRLLSLLRDIGLIAPAPTPQRTPHEQIFGEFSQYLRKERGLASTSIIAHLPHIRLFLHEVCSPGASGLAQIGPDDVVRFIERHAHDRSSASGKGMCWALRSFFRYLQQKGLNSLALANCVPSIRRWKLATLPTYRTHPVKAAVRRRS